MGEKAVGSALSHDCPSPERELVQTLKIFPQVYLSLSLFFSLSLSFFLKQQF